MRPLPDLLSSFLADARDQIPDRADIAADLGIAADAGRSRARLAAEVVGGTAAVAVGGLVAYYVFERLHEEAAFTVVEQDGAFTLRRYAPVVFATTQAEGNMTTALDRGYDRLSAYIGAREGGRAPSASDQRIAMAVPVTVAPAEQAGAGKAGTGHAGTWDVRFTMPNSWLRDALPEPGPGVALEEVPARLVAAVHFAGRGTDRTRVNRKRDALLDWVRERSLHTTGNAEFAAYNAPIVPGFARRNEWWVPVTA